MKGGTTMREIRAPKSGMVRVKWDLSVPTVYLFGTLAGQMGMSRSEMLSDLLSDAHSRRSQEGSPGALLVAREGQRSRESLLLPRELVFRLEEDAAEHGWSVELLVEHLSSDYLAVWSGELHRDAIAPVSYETPRVWLSDYTRQPRFLSRRGWAA